MHKEMCFQMGNQVRGPKKSLENYKTILRVQVRFKNELHKVFTEKVKKITLSANDNKRLQTFDWAISYPYGAGAERVCKTELMRHWSIKKWV